MSPQESNRPEEMDLREVLSVMIKRKNAIFLTIIAAIFLGSIYCLISTPVYRGDVLMEVGEVIMVEGNISKNTVVQPIDQSNEIQAIALTLMNKNIDKNSVLRIYPPRGSLRLLGIRYETTDRGGLSGTIQKVIDLIISRHKEKYDFYSKSNLNVRPTRVVGEIILKEDPIWPNTKKIIGGSALAGFLLGLFLIFVLEFVQKRR